MKIAVIGANGLVGRPVVAEALKRGHLVDAYTRSGEAPEGAAGFAVDITDTADVAEIINNHDFTVISVAGRDDYAAVQKAHADLIATQPFGRFLVVGGAGALNAGAGRLYDSPDFPEEYKIEAKTFGAIYDSYLEGAQGLKWSMIAPAPMIAPGEATAYRVEKDVPAGGFVSNATFAVAIIDEAEEATHLGGRFTVANV